MTPRIHPEPTYPRSDWFADVKRFAWRAAKVIYWSTAAVMIATGASVVVGLVAFFVFPFLPLLTFFPLMSALGATESPTRGGAGETARAPGTPSLAARNLFVGQA